MFLPIKVLVLNCMSLAKLEFKCLLITFKLNQKTSLFHPTQTVEITSSICSGISDCLNPITSKQKCTL